MQHLSVELNDENTLPVVEEILCLMQQQMDNDKYLHGFLMTFVGYDDFVSCVDNIRKKTVDFEELKEVCQYEPRLGSDFIHCFHPLYFLGRLPRYRLLFQDLKKWSNQILPQQTNDRMDHLLETMVSKALEKINSHMRIFSCLTDRTILLEDDFHLEKVFVGMEMTIHEKSTGFLSKILKKNGTKQILIGGMMLMSNQCKIVCCDKMTLTAAPSTQPVNSLKWLEVIPFSTNNTKRYIPWK